MSGRDFHARGTLLPMRIWMANNRAITYILGALNLLPKTLALGINASFTQKYGNGREKAKRIQIYIYLRHPRPRPDDQRRPSTMCCTFVYNKLREMRVTSSSTNRMTSINMLTPTPQLCPSRAADQCWATHTSMIGIRSLEGTAIGTGIQCRSRCRRPWVVVTVAISAISWTRDWDGCITGGEVVINTRWNCSLNLRTRPAGDFIWLLKELVARTRVITGALKDTR